MSLFQGDCLDVLNGLPSNSVDSLVTDPPAGISFMGKAWDGDKGGRKEWVAWMTEVMRECFRVMKPGAHGLVWALPRTSHWTATALEDAGFEVRDVITHLFGQGFPKSLDISKAIDKAAGVEGPIVGKNPAFRERQLEHDAQWPTPMRPEFKRGPATDAAKQWSGWGTALKPASEHWILIRKPCAEKTVAANVLKWGTGGINIDGCRIEGNSDQMRGRSGTALNPGGDATSYRAHNADGGIWEPNAQGRFPANLVLSHSAYCTDEQCDIECAIEALDRQSGTLKSGSRAEGVRKGFGHQGASGDGGPDIAANHGGASRFFYCAKISSSERNAGLEAMPDVEAGIGDERPSGQSMSRLDGRPARVVKNHHPTVKPQKLMRYLCRLVTPPGGKILDPFMGSGSTGLAAHAEGFGFIGIEREPDYFKISEARLESHSKTI